MKTRFYKYVGERTYAENKFLCEIEMDQVPRENETVILKDIRYTIDDVTWFLETPQCFVMLLADGENEQLPPDGR